MSKLSGLLMFALGAGVGSSAMYFYMRDKFDAEQSEREAQLKAAYDIKCNSTKVETTEEKKEEPYVQINRELKETMIKEKKSITDYANVIKKENYVEKQEEEDMPIDGEILIEPDNHDDVIGFGMEPFETVFATIYADGYLVDSDDNIIDIDDKIGGVETLEHFGEGDDPELLHVRNNLYEIDYEIDRDDRTYVEVSGKNPADLPPID